MEYNERIQTMSAVSGSQPVKSGNVPQVEVRQIPANSTNSGLLATHWPSRELETVFRQIGAAGASTIILIL